MATTYHSSVTALCDALEADYAQLATTMRQITDPSPRAVGTWSIGETALHVSGSADYFLAALRGEAELERLDEIDASNAQALAQNTERDPRVLADVLVHGGEALVTYARGIHGDPPATPFAGVEVPVSSVLGIELGEVLVHGHDMARAAGLPWHIDRAHARLTLEAYLPLLPYMLDKERAAGVQLAIDLRVRGMRPALVRVHKGSLTVEDPRGQAVDVHVLVDPVVYLLLTWNRIAAWKPMLRGQLLMWGRRPWRMNEFGALLQT